MPPQRRSQAEPSLVERTCFLCFQQHRGFVPPVLMSLISRGMLRQRRPCLGLRRGRSSASPRTRAEPDCRRAGWGLNRAQAEPSGRQGSAFQRAASRAAPTPESQPRSPSSFLCNKLVASFENIYAIPRRAAGRGEPLLRGAAPARNTNTCSLFCQAGRSVRPPYLVAGAGSVAGFFFLKSPLRPCTSAAGSWGCWGAWPSWVVCFCPPSRP